MTELAFCLVDCGDHFYKQAAHEMIRSVIRVMPDVKIIQISDSKTPQHPEAHAIISADVSCPKEKVTLFKGHFMAEYAKQCSDNLILSDVDLIFNKPFEPTFWKHWGQNGVALMSRQGFPCMPFNTGLMFSLSNERSKRFWGGYLDIIDDLDKNGMGGWYCDQIAASIAAKYGVHCLDMAKIAAAPSEKPTGKLESYATHFKGDRKSWMSGYSELLKCSA